SRTVRIVQQDEHGLLVEETLGRIGGETIDEYDALPVALTPGSPPPAGAQQGAIEAWGQRLRAALDRAAPERAAGLTEPGTPHAPAAAWPNDAVADLLRRRPPRLRSGRAPVAVDSAEALASGGGEDARLIGAVTESLLALEHSYLAVQGPPGTGKTYLASRVIRALVERHGWRIGVVAQSHRVVENVLSGVVAAGLDPDRVGKVAQRGREAEPADYTVLSSNGQAAFARDREPGGYVLGGTAWDFANEKRFARGQLDLLVVDEAAQFSLAPTIAASAAAERLLLLGDPQQLPQVSQGAHPEPVDESALGWLVDGAEVLPAALGYFLAESRRMRPEVTGPVSELSYGGRLRAHPAAAERALDGHAPGVSTHLVEHRGNATFSPEEAAEVVRIVRSVVGSVWHPGGGRAARPATPADVIVVAPYNAQVECIAEALAAAGLGEVPVGTVDKFQGQEAAVAILSTAASSPAEVPRGMEFLLMRNRLNVAISRAQVAAHVVTSAFLTEMLPASPQAMADLSAFLRLTGRSR
ncbi:DEAD/DEAH box helicase, partial [Leucobacter sp. M11]|uniref:DEAD/DEAH box helicase n=1 Tax=Leucobacter sp. M11 TaxID=2993565 RepID=UPI002D7E20EC